MVRLRRELSRTLSRTIALIPADFVICAYLRDLREIKYLTLFANFGIYREMPEVYSRDCDPLMMISNRLADT